MDAARAAALVRVAAVDSGTPIEVIADLVGHSGTRVTEAVYRHQLRPVLLSGAVAFDRVLGFDDRG